MPRQGIENLTIDANGVITLPAGFPHRDRWFVKVDTFGGAGTDDLIAILGGKPGDEIVLMQQDMAHNVKVKDDVADAGGNKLQTAGDFTLNQVRDKMMLIRVTNLRWDELTRSPN